MSSNSKKNSFEKIDPIIPINEKVEIQRIVKKSKKSIMDNAFKEMQVRMLNKMLKNILEN